MSSGNSVLLVLSVGVHGEGVGEVGSLRVGVLIFGIVKVGSVAGAGRGLMGARAAARGRAGAGRYDGAAQLLGGLVGDLTQRFGLVRRSVVDVVGVEVRMGLVLSRGTVVILQVDRVCSKGRTMGDNVSQEILGNVVWRGAKIK